MELNKHQKELAIQSTLDEFKDTWVYKKVMRKVKRNRSLFAGWSNNYMLLFALYCADPNDIGDLSDADKAKFKEKAKAINAEDLLNKEAAKKH